MKLTQVDLSKEQLDRIPDDERRLLVLVAHAANELNALAKLFHFAASSAKEGGILGQAETAQAMVLARVLTGKLYEFWVLLEGSFFRAQLAKAYEQEMVDESKEALKALKGYFGRRDNLISKVRNQFAFHYSPDHIDAGYKALIDGDPLQIYTAEDYANSLYVFADTIAGRAMLEAIQPGSPADAMNVLITETSATLGHMNSLIGGIIKICMERHVVTRLYDLESTEAEVEDVADSQMVRIPFFVEHRSDES